MRGNTTLAVLALIASGWLSTAPAMAQAPAAERGGPQMTDAEYKKLKSGMTKKKVTSIVASSGRVYSKGPGCLIKQYSATNGRTAFVAFNEGQLMYKKRLVPDVQGYPQICPTPA